MGPVEPADQPPPPTVAPPKKNHRRLIVLATVVGIIVVLIALGQNSDKQTSNAPSSPTSGQAPASPAAMPTMSGIGQEARDGKFAFVVTSVDRSKTAGDPSNQFETVTAQGEFLNVHLTVSNIGDQSQSFFASNQKLQIGGNQFSANDTAAAMWTQSADVSINPGNSIQAVVSFDVPPDTTDNGVITLHDSAFSGGVKVSLQSPGQ